MKERKGAERRMRMCGCVCVCMGRFREEEHVCNVFLEVRFGIRFGVNGARSLKIRRDFLNACSLYNHLVK